MSSSPSDIIVVSVVQRYVDYIHMVNFAMGIVGNVLNSLVLMNLTVFRGNQCAFYLYVESLVNIAVLIFRLIDRLTQYPDGTDLADYSIVWCKLRIVLDQLTQLIPFSVICLAAFDQNLSTNHRHAWRKLSSLRSAQRLVLTVACLSLIHSLPVVSSFGLYAPIGCITSDRRAISYYLYFYYPALVGLLPIFVSSLFSLIAFRNVRHLIRRQIPMVRRRLDRQLTAMVFTRVLTFDMLHLPYVVYRTYTLTVLISTTYDIPFLFDQLMQTTVVLLTTVNSTVGPIPLSSRSTNEFLLDFVLRISILIATVPASNEIFLDQQVRLILATMLSIESTSNSPTSRCLSSIDGGIRIMNPAHTLDDAVSCSDVVRVNRMFLDVKNRMRYF